MTNEQAIKVLTMVEAHGSLVIKAKEMAIKALEQEPCEDAISRQAVLDLLEDTNNGWIINEVSQLPSVKPQDCDTCEVCNPCLYCKHEFEPQESEG